jgi:hypothetical protein
VAPAVGRHHGRLRSRWHDHAQPQFAAVDPPGRLDAAELRTVLGNFPLSSLATFAGLGITNELIRELTGPAAG